MAAYCSRDRRRKRDWEFQGLKTPLLPRTYLLRLAAKSGKEIYSMENNKTDSPANAALVIGNEIKQIVAGTPLEKEAMILGAMYASGYFKDLNSLSKAVTKALIGQQMGMGLVQSMNSLYVIDGKVAMDSHAIRNTAVMAGYTIKTLELSEKTCVLEWSFKNEVLGKSEFSWDDATKAGLVNKDNWRKYPKDMLFARAVTRGSRMYANQAFGNQPIYERDEIKDDGKYIDLGPLDDRVDKIRNAKDTEALQDIMNGLNADEKKALADEISAKTQELLDGTSTEN
jgi:hypothetical protein